MLHNFRPLEFRQVLRETFSLYRHNFLLFLGISAVPNIGLLLLKLEFIQLGMLATHTDGTLQTLSSLATVVTGLFAVSVTTAATAFAVSDVYLDRTPDLGSCFSRVFPRAWRILYVALRVELTIGIGSLMLIVPGFYWAGAYGLAVPAVALENLSGKQSLQRSRELTQDAVGRIVLSFFIASILTGLATTLLNGYFNTTSLAPQLKWLTREMVREVNSAAAATLFGPLSAIALVLDYFDQRVRKEQFDIQKMMKSAALPEVLAPEPIA